MDNLEACIGRACHIKGYQTWLRWMQMMLKYLSKMKDEESVPKKDSRGHKHSSFSWDFIHNSYKEHEYIAHHYKLQEMVKN
jgi:hypothetical protein